MWFGRPRKPETVLILPNPNPNLKRFGLFKVPVRRPPWGFCFSKPGWLYTLKFRVLVLVETTLYWGRKLPCRLTNGVDSGKILPPDGKLVRQGGFFDAYCKSVIYGLDRNKPIPIDFPLFHLRQKQMEKIIPTLFATALVISSVPLVTGCGGGISDDPTAKTTGDAIRQEDPKDTTPTAEPEEEKQ